MSDTETSNSGIYNMSKIILMVISVSIGGLAVGYNSGIVAGALLYLDDAYPGIEISTKSRFVSYAILGGTIGALLTGQISDRLGRKFTILLSDAFLIVGPLILCVAFAPILLCIGRLILGFGQGISMMLCPIFLSETSPIAIRGQLVPTYFFLYFTGLLISYCSGVFCQGKLALMFGIAIIPALIQVVLMLFTQTEPAIFLAKQGKMVEAGKVLKSYYTLNSQESQHEYERHNNELLISKQEESQDKSSILSMFYQLFTTYRWNLFVGCMLHSLQQFTGINLIQYYGPYFMRDAGFASDSKNGLLFSMMAIAVVIMIGNFICITISKRFGRRQLILLCTIPMALSLLVLTVVIVINTMFTNNTFTAGGWISVLALGIYMIFCAIGFATQPWTICSEIFPTHIKGSAIAITTTANWGFNYFLSSIFLWATDGPLMKVFTYSILTLSCVIVFFFTLRFVPETKGKPQDECVRLVMNSKHGIFSGVEREGLLDIQPPSNVQMVQQKQPRRKRNL